jgi:hypothetical protein
MGNAGTAIDHSEPGQSYRLNLVGRGREVDPLADRVRPNLDDDPFRFVGGELHFDLFAVVEVVAATSRLSRRRPER